ncbi:HIT zinc finger domain-containing protein [Spironucleus salmonicida]|uniref:HIT zinc finger domain-containing protein n=1 Tax=Spironucleus salmonicida TaxID=348837 RepID=V6LUE7_9EUKA|nr:HIT zinc finger domain-containing protein [Spironucleus salmonicida]|eukprot:EST48247.1 HIT zinc finger domain-containing protein [Spironucleus salmonicida]
MDALHQQQNDTKFQSVELQSTKKNFKKLVSDTQQTTKQDALDYVQFDYQEDPSQLTATPNLFSATVFATGNATGARCIICQKERAPYACSGDKCNARYCSSQCFQEHKRQSQCFK